MEPLRLLWSNSRPSAKLCQIFVRLRIVFDTPKNCYILIGNTVSWLLIPNSNHLILSELCTTIHALINHIPFPDFPSMCKSSSHDSDRQFEPQKSSSSRAARVRLLVDRSSPNPMIPKRYGWHCVAVGLGGFFCSFLQFYTACQLITIADFPPFADFRKIWFDGGRGLGTGG